MKMPGNISLPEDIIRAIEIFAEGKENSKCFINLIDMVYFDLNASRPKCILNYKIKTCWSGRQHSVSSLIF